MRKLSSLITGAALTLTAGLLGCGVDDVGDTFDSLTTAANDETTGDGDGDATGDGDGDGDPTTGDGDGDATGDGDPSTGDGDGDCEPGGFGEPCCDGLCDAGLVCDGTMCGLGGGDGDGDGDPTGDGDGDPWDPSNPACEGPVGVGMIEGQFCAHMCVDSIDCPPAPPGTQGQCALSTMAGEDPSLCALICQVSADACPAGSTCKSAMQMDPDVGLCTYP